MFEKSRMKTPAISIPLRLALLFSVVLLAGAGFLLADEWDKSQEEKWNKAFMETVAEGDRLFHGPELAGNTVQCAMCHPNATNTHPETYPKFQKQLGKVATMREMINWCIRNPLQGTELKYDDPKMIAIEAYILYERRNVPLAPGKH
ncbi:MAG: cytochrome C [Leptonema illini]|uniref:Cytochrome C n=1 Tax=Leptonema illini TaxID=183 RepID=A0A833GZ69_9LEPT|nr:MAG: cytochrome C [Leptonema illini]PKL30113.1 MAG: cytochrome C [Spirochaetae bacterium HGW-Spirochaetae-10]